MTNVIFYGVGNQASVPWSNAQTFLQRIKLVPTQDPNMSGSYFGDGKAIYGHPVDPTGTVTFNNLLSGTYTVYLMDQYTNTPFYLNVPEMNGGTVDASQYITTITSSVVNSGTLAYTMAASDNRYIRFANISGSSPITITASNAINAINSLTASSIPAVLPSYVGPLNIVTHNNNDGTIYQSTVTADNNGNLVGNLTGTASFATSASRALNSNNSTNSTNATNASNITVGVCTSANTTGYLLIVPNSGTVAGYMTSSVKFTNNPDTLTMANVSATTVTASIINAPSISGSVYITPVTVNAPMPICFTGVGSLSPGYFPLQSDSNFYFNPSTNILTVPTVIGNLTGTASLATTASYSLSSWNFQQTASAIATPLAGGHWYNVAQILSSLARGGAMVELGAQSGNSVPLRTMFWFGSNSSQNTGNTASVAMNLIYNTPGNWVSQIRLVQVSSSVAAQFWADAYVPNSVTQSFGTTVYIDPYNPGEPAASAIPFILHDNLSVSESVSLIMDISNNTVFNAASNASGLSGSTLFQINSTGIHTTLPLSGSTISCSVITASLFYGTASISNSGSVSAVTNNATYYLDISPGSSGNQPTNIATSLTYNPSTNILTVPTLAAKFSSSNDIVIGVANDIYQARYSDNAAVLRFGQLSGSDNTTIFSPYSSAGIIQFSNQNGTASVFVLPGVGSVHATSFTASNISASFITSSGVYMSSLSYATGSSAPSNTTTPAAWIGVTVSGSTYKMPLYL